MGKRIESERKALGWTQAQLAHKVDPENFSQQALDRLEKRDSDTSKFAVQIADALGVNLRWLLTGNGRKDEPDWPFLRVRRDRWDACDEGDRGYVQAAMNKAMDECEAARGKPSAKPPALAA
jgi:transcriptional regulator with XRE-family HTH domain